jgi:hypothetical protein
MESIFQKLWDAHDELAHDVDVATNDVIDPDDDPFDIVELRWSGYGRQAIDQLEEDIGMPPTGTLVARYD